MIVIANLSVLCNDRFGIGLSDVRGGGTAGALIIAHELGHNFGAPHDNQSGSPCRSTPGGFLMNPFLNGSDTFSQCSLAQIQPNVANANCIVAVTPDPDPDPDPDIIIFEEHFDRNKGGFQYADNLYRDANERRYARGDFRCPGGFSGGRLRGRLGGRNNRTILGMSGGWRRTFSLATAQRVSVSLRYNLTQSANYEEDEFSDILLVVYGALVGRNGDDVHARIFGKGNGGSVLTTDLVSVDVDLGMLSAGEHTLSIGGFNNKKTSRGELSDMLIDDVVLRGQE